MRNARHNTLTAAVLGIVGLLAAACGAGGGSAGAGDGPAITVGTVNFAENRILGQIYAQVLEANGYPVTAVKENIGAREVVAPALAAGQLDLVVEYTGNYLRFQRQGEDIDLRDVEEVYQALQAELEDDALQALAYSQAQDVDGLAVTRQTAVEHGLEKISDIGAEFPGTFRFGAGPECVERLSCLEGYRQIYGFGEDEFVFVSLDVAGPLTVEALKSGEVDGANLFTTQSVVAANDFVILEDDKNMQLPQNIVPVVRREILDAYGQDLVDLLDSVTERFTTEGLTELNAKVEIEQQDPEDVARLWLEDNGFVQ